MTWLSFIKYFLDGLLMDEVLNSHISSVHCTCIDCLMIMYFMFLECPLSSLQDGRMGCLFVAVYETHMDHMPILDQVR
jgi:hypothetical protein